mmetsp:Transcript_1239/g.2870  ORF Transcript_1239/g.2870 Transcript_1239/m.2870 type:complete len:251 (+) Transcript_1239:414-1166(+)
MAPRGPGAPQRLRLRQRLRLPQRLRRRESARRRSGRGGQEGRRRALRGEECDARHLLRRRRTRRHLRALHAASSGEAPAGGGTQRDCAEDRHRYHRSQGAPAARQGAVRGDMRLVVRAGRIARRCQGLSAAPLLRRVARVQAAVVRQAGALRSTRGELRERMRTHKPPWLRDNPKISPDQCVTGLSGQPCLVAVSVSGCHLLYLLLLGDGSYQLFERAFHPGAQRALTFVRCAPLKWRSESLCSSRGGAS